MFKKKETPLEIGKRLAAWVINKDENKTILFTYPEHGVYIVNTKESRESVEAHALRINNKCIVLKDEGVSESEPLEESFEPKEEKAKRGPKPKNK